MRRVAVSPLGRGRHRLTEFRQSEIQQFHPAIFGDDDVRGLQVAVVNDPGRMGRSERIRDLGGIFHRLFQRQVACGIQPAPACYRETYSIAMETNSCLLSEMSQIVMMVLG